MGSVVPSVDSEGTVTGGSVSFEVSGVVCGGSVSFEVSGVVCGGSVSVVSGGSGSVVSESRLLCPKASELR